MSSTGDLYTYNHSEANALLITQLVFMVILLALFIYWHYLHPDSLEVTRQLEKDLIESTEERGAA